MNSGEERVICHHIMLHLKEAEIPEYRKLIQSCLVCGQEDCRVLHHPYFLTPTEEPSDSKSPWAGGTVAPK